jgi:HemY protein
MIRVILYLVAVAVLAICAVWVADRPGVVVVDWPWLGQPREVNIGLAIVALVVFAVLAIVLWSFYSGVINLPKFLTMMRRQRRASHGFTAITRGLIAVGAGDPYAARRFARDAQRFAPEEPLALLLAAQSAQLAGNRAAAEQVFRQMAERGDTKLIGLHGLFVEAQRRDDHAAARLYAEEATRTAPSLGWAAQAVLDFRCAAGDWVGAIEALELNLKNELIGKRDYRRKRAVLLTARATALAETEREAAIAMVLDAVRLAPDLVPAVALAGRLLADAGEERRAARLIERAWYGGPHPDLAEVYAHLRPGDSARDRLARVEALSQRTPGHLEGALAVARCAIDAREFSVARSVLAPFVSTLTQRVAMLMAEIEDLEHGDVGRARAWMARAMAAERDPAWTADGVVSDRWLPISPVTGRLDVFEWRVPLAHVGTPGKVIDQRSTAPVDAPVVVTREREPEVVAEPEILHEETQVEAAADVSSVSIPAVTPFAARAASPEAPAVAAAATSETSIAAASASATTAGSMPSAPSPIPATPTSPSPSPSSSSSSPAQAAPSSTLLPPTGLPAPQFLGTTGSRPRPSEAVIPLLHVPDDPGPGEEVDDEPTLQRDGDGWRRLRELF